MLTTRLVGGVRTFLSFYLTCPSFVLCGYCLFVVSNVVTVSLFLSGYLFVDVTLFVSWVSLSNAVAGVEFADEYAPVSG